MAKPTAKQVRDSVGVLAASPDSEVKRLGDRLLRQPSLSGLTAAEEFEIHKTNLDKADDLLVLQEVELASAWISSNRSVISLDDQAARKLRFLAIESSLTAPNSVVVFMRQYVEQNELTTDEIAERFGEVLAIPSLDLVLETDPELRARYSRLVQRVDMDQLAPL